MFSKKKVPINAGLIPMPAPPSPRRVRLEDLIADLKSKIQSGQNHRARIIEEIRRGIEKANEIAGCLERLSLELEKLEQAEAAIEEQDNARIEAALKTAVELVDAEGVQ